MFATWITPQIVFNGIVAGMATALVAMGLVLIFRATKVINFAVGNMGLPASALMALLVVQYDLGFWLALFISMVVGAAFAGVVEFIVVRRLFRAPRVIVLVATIGVAQLAQAIVRGYPSIDSGGRANYPAAVGRTWADAWFDLRITGPQVQTLVVVPVITIVLAWFLNRTTFGRTVKAAADNPELARLCGISPKTVSSFVWIVGGLLSSISLILLSSSSRTLTGIQNLGPSTLSRALVAAVIAGMVSFPRALLASLLLGVAESLVGFNFQESGLIDFLLLVAVVIAVSFQARSSRAESATFSFASRVNAIPEHLQRVWWIRLLPAMAGGLALAFAIVLPFLVTTPSRQFLYSTILAFAIGALSVVVITGWAGQLSLGQMAFAGIGALFAAALHRGASLDIGWRSTRLLVVEFVPQPWALSLLAGALFAGVVAVLVGLTALRLPGLLLAVTTFAFALAAQQYLYKRPFLSDNRTTSVPFDRGTVFGIGIDDQRSYYYLCLVLLVVSMLVVARLRRTGVGRSIIAVRDNPDTAAAYTVPAARTKLVAFAIGGFLAGLSGGLLAGALRNVPLTDGFFEVNDSLRLVAIAVIGGLGSVSGALLGTLWVIGLPKFFGSNDIVPLLTSSIGLLVLLLYFPGGFVQIGYSARDAIVRWAHRRYPTPPVVRAATTTPVPTRGERRVADPDEIALAVRSMSVQFGGNKVLHNVDIDVRGGEVVGLIGTNGAGKTTLLNAIGGYVPSEGEVELFGRRVERLHSPARARAGFGRTFQAATLFPELTVRETVMVALEGRGRTGVLTSAFALPPSPQRERTRRREADELIDFLGLGGYADRFIADLSTGTRRIVELAGLLALDARVLCLDEPTAGVAQRETEAFGPLLAEIRRELGASMVVIEHDMPLIMSISDRVYCLELGSVIAEGLPNVVRNDPAVIASYLGTDDRAISRSDTGS